MRKTILILVLLVTVTTIMTSCASYKGSERGGCRATQGFIGYR